jgi:hypothetical protein
LDKKRLEVKILVLFYHLDGALWTRGFASAADYAVTDPNWNRFTIFHLINAYWTNVYASFATIAFFTNLDFYHIHTLMLTKRIFPIKGFSKIFDFSI